MAKTYGAICNRFPELQIGETIRFRDGLFETNDETVWATLQSNEWWGVHIHPRDVMAAPWAAPSPEPVSEPVSESAVTDPETEVEHPRPARHGQRGTRG